MLPCVMDLVQQYNAELRQCSYSTAGMVVCQQAGSLKLALWVHGECKVLVQPEVEIQMILSNPHLIAEVTGGQSHP
jgi:hypothetical protein